jgi:phosphoribosyl-dephospho-CoA transferase
VTALQRHTLVWLHPAAWQNILARPAGDEPDAECLAHWAAHDLPLVVTRQPAGTVDAWQLGLSAPLGWSRRRIFLSVPAAGLARTGAFPLAEEIDWPDRAAEAAMRHALFAELAQAGAPARVYGSFGWQACSGLAHVRADSDIDLLLAVEDAQMADAVVAVLERTPLDSRRFDGELVFPGGAAMAWREWSAWRKSGRGAILVKRLRTTTLESRLEDFA